MELLVGLWGGDSWSESSPSLQEEQAGGGPSDFAESVWARGGLAPWMSRSSRPSSEDQPGHPERLCQRLVW